jgi:hypothetical protein
MNEYYDEIYKYIIHYNDAEKIEKEENDEWLNKKFNEYNLSTAAIISLGGKEERELFKKEMEIFLEEIEKEWIENKNK